MEKTGIKSREIRNKPERIVGRPNYSSDNESIIESGCLSK